MSVELRDGIIDFLRREIVGPDPQLPAVQSGVPDPRFRNQEIIRAEDPPRVRYGAGILFPGKARVETQDNLSEDAAPAEAPLGATSAGEDLSTEDGVSVPPAPFAGETENATEASNDLEVNRANEYLPSAMGISVLMHIPDRLIVRVRCATYEKVDVPGWGRHSKATGKVFGAHGWFRAPIEQDVPFEQDALMSEEGMTKEEPVPGTEGLRVHVFSRPASSLEGDDGQRIVTVTLINRRQAAKERASDEECYFQCGLSLLGPEGELCIREYPIQAPNAEDDPEELSLRLLYRHRKAFGVGHGCAVNWPDTEANGVDSVWSESMPVFEMKPIVPSEFPGVTLSMGTLASDEGVHAVRLSIQLADTYAAWIEQQQQALAADPTLPELLRARGSTHLESCRECLRRIRSGIDLLRRDATVRRAFTLMNRAMLMQQIHYRISSSAVRNWVRSGAGAKLERPFAPPSYDDVSRKWRPFQLAFVLMNLEPISNPDSEHRDVVDVIWFPTGGGKTEAYLGLTAFTILIRRLRNNTNAGTTVLMRYTLRLLTTQQFQRAASLICALEMLRRESPASLGGADTPITIGLWVGSSVTPNNEKEAVKAFRKLTQHGAENPFILRSCPWCGAQMGPVVIGNSRQVKGYKELPSPQRVRFVCGDEACPFNSGEGLPVQAIDEHLYKSPPSLLIGTVDKFAMLPWTPDSRRLFGIDTGGNFSPPELIIQDELHLISGPLGSMVGLYETLIDVLCTTADGRRPRIVASTATIARAGEQVRALYARQRLQLFPPQALRAGESFFATENRMASGRAYVGVFASGLPSQVTAQVRVLASLLQAPLSVPGERNDLLDRYWTLMVYFNSIRELGHAATLVRADIAEYMRAMWERLGIAGPNRLTGDLDLRRWVNRDLELTSRVSSSEVTEVMNDLFTPVGRDDAKPIDICLATNMIQVGLDVPRLNLMAIVGQPKTTSEYIQASSRVGRETPGLVVTILNPGKPRDRSHFEHFRAYHESIYSHVEPTSVTPFALPVRERALHALFIALARVWGSTSLRETPLDAPPQALVDRITDSILARVKFVDEVEVESAGDQLAGLFEEWRRVPPSRYGKFGAPEPEPPMMYPAGSQELPEWDGRAIQTPSSMRNVDATCNAKAVSSYPGV